jgi:phosphoglycerate kinase
MTIKSIRKVKNLKGKKIFLRVDFNVPLRNGKVEEDFKIVASLPTIRFLLSQKSKIIIASHLGRPVNSPKSKVQSRKIFSLEPVAKRLGQLLGREVKFINDCVGEKVKSEIEELKEGEIIFLENLRFYKEEENNDADFAKKLAALADMYVNDAFAVCHRTNASTVAIKKYLPFCAGLLLENEIKNLTKIFKPKKPLVAIIGGAKMETKIALLKKFKKIADYIIIGGALANNFLKANGYEIGKSLISKNEINLAKKVMARKIILPVDVIVSKKKDDSGRPVAKKIGEVNKNEIIFDIGPETIKLYASLIKKAQTIVWNGPLGKYEFEHFRHGTLAIARVVAARSGGPVFGVVGGGETIEALNMTKMANYVDWVSSGGGAMLSFLGGEKMPGLEGIIK